ncbi:MAG: EAL domain-containing protein, partial [Rubrobacteraceae bacterium]
TGYSSLAYLRRFPVDSLKIDRSIIQGLGEDPKNEAIVSAVITLAHALDERVVAEGVETERQLTRLREIGCDFAQGYYFAKPLPGEEAGLLVGSGLNR